MRRGCRSRISISIAIGSPAELDELGFAEAAADGVVLVEWPERAGDRLPADAIVVELTQLGDGRLARISDGRGDGKAASARSPSATFSTARVGRPRIGHISAGDASARTYETVQRDGSAPAILMNSPPLVLGPPVRGGKAYAEIAHTARSVSAFVAIDRLLHAHGFAVPEIFAAGSRPRLPADREPGLRGFPRAKTARRSPSAMRPRPRCSPTCTAGAWPREAEVAAGHDACHPALRSRGDHDRGGPAA